MSMSIYLRICPVCLSIDLSIRPAIYVSLYRSISPLVCLRCRVRSTRCSVGAPTCNRVGWSVYSSVCPSIGLSTRHCVGRWVGLFLMSLLLELYLIYCITVFQFRLPVLYPLRYTLVSNSFVDLWPPVKLTTGQSIV